MARRFSELSLVLLLVAAPACFSTQYDLTSQGAPRRQLITPLPPPDGWYQPGFDDSTWQMTGAPTETMTAEGGTMPTIYVRQRFDLGSNPDRYQKLTLHYDVDGDVVAYINGQPLAPGKDGTQTLALTPGMCKPSDNVLALEIHSTRATVEMDARLDGDTTGAHGSQIVKGPYLLRPTPDGVTIRWQTASDTQGQAIVDGRAYDGLGGTWHTATVTGLEPDHAYTYHVEGGGTRSEDAQLTTAPPAGKRIRFVVFGDNRTGGDVHRQLVEGLLAEAPDFIVNTGDMVGESTGSEWQTFFDIEYPLMLQTPLYPVMGNHEHDYGQADRFQQLFPLGDPQRSSGRVYSFDYGSAHVAILDSNGNLGSQSKWLDADLAAADARGQRSFVALHFGPVCGCSGIQHGSNDDARPVLDVAGRHRVAVIFSGHNHLYERGIKNGITYVVTGGGGAPLNSTGTTASTQATFANYHYVVVDLLGDEVHLTAKSAQGDVLDDAAVPVRP
jgi:predicted phosphodiesterase